VFRAKLILMRAEGASFSASKRKLQTTAPTIVRWKERFRQHGLEGVDTYHPGEKPSVLTPALRARILSATPRKPSRTGLERLASDAVEFEAKAADILGLYLRPPQHAAVFWVDEKTAIQAWDRLDPVLPLSPGRAERHGFEYYRHGTLSVYAALNTAHRPRPRQDCRPPHPPRVHCLSPRSRILARLGNRFNHPRQSLRPQNSGGP
jgi:Homeodomain-like domain